MISFLITFIVGGVLGYFERDIRAKVSELYKRLPEDKEPEVGATDASYGIYNPDAKVNQANEVGISEPKSPQRLEFEENQRLEAMQQVKTTRK